MDKNGAFWKALKVLVEILLIIAAICAFCILIASISVAESDPDEAYVFCSDFVNIRSSPYRNGAVIGRFESGDSLLIDGKQKNGYLHCVNLSLEQADGWIHKGYVVHDKPSRMNQTATIVSKGRLAARNNVGGKRTRWLKPQASLTVYWWSDDWCITNCGYVQTRYLELEGE